MWVLLVPWFHAHRSLASRWSLDAGPDFGGTGFANVCNHVCRSTDRHSVPGHSGAIHLDFVDVDDSNLHWFLPDRFAVEGSCDLVYSHFGGFERERLGSIGVVP